VPPGGGARWMITAYMSRDLPTSVRSGGLLADGDVELVEELADAPFDLVANGPDLLDGQASWVVEGPVFVPFSGEDVRPRAWTAAAGLDHATTGRVTPRRPHGSDMTRPGRGRRGPARRLCGPAG
jgi:hypothetical protein